MSSELIYTDGACSKNGTPQATGGFGIFFAKSTIFNAPAKVNRKGEVMKFADETFYVSNIRTEGLAIVTTLAVYANVLIENISTGKPDILTRLNQCDPFRTEGFKIGYEFDELRSFNQVEPTLIEIVTDSQFWINVIEAWLPGWIRKNIALQKKNPDIILMLHHYMELFRQNNVTIKFTHVRSHQKGKRSLHADGNDVADVLATSSVKNPTTDFYQQ
jgi:ribonuclease HI